MKRMLILVIAVLAIVTIVAAVHWEGEVQAVSPLLAVRLDGSEGWYDAPHMAADDGDPAVVYVVAPALPHGERFDAVKVDVATRAQTHTTVALGPGNAFRWADARVAVNGIRFPRPALHLFTFPDGKGPGFHAVDSATGRIVISADDGGRQRPLLTRIAFNSGSAAEMASLVTTDPAGRWFAAFSRSSGGWKLFLFPRSAASGRAGH